MIKQILYFFKLHNTITLLLAIAWTIGIFIGCSLPGKDLPSISLFDHFDKVVHFTFFAIFFILWYISFNPKPYIPYYLLLLTAFYGFGIEWYQLNCVVGRSFDILDGIADTIGGLTGWILIKYLDL